MSHLDNGVELHVVVTIKPETINLPSFGFYKDIGLMETIIYHEPIGQYSFRLHRRNTSPCCRIHQTLWWFSWWLAHCCLWVAEVPTLNRFGIISVEVSGQVWILKNPNIPSIPCIASSLRWVQHLKRKCENHHILDQNQHLQNERESEAFSSWPPDHLYKIYALAEYRKTHSRLPLNTRRSFYLR